MIRDQGFGYSAVDAFNGAYRLAAIDKKDGYILVKNPRFRVFGTVSNVFDKYGPFLPDGTDSGNAYNYSSVYGVAGRAFTLGLQFDY